ncbi:MAG: zinc-ribbon domain-containing protein [Chloroflexi bacterium]|nr:zinc-ribbon domain-containing protein [Chloroflexota bacterium]
MNKPKEEEICRCPYCDLPTVSPHPPFCTHCGVQLRFCPHCQSAVPREATSCSHCGASLT